MIIRGPGAFPRTSGAKNPIVIVKIFIFIFLAKSGAAGYTIPGRAVKFGGLVQTPACTSDTKNYIYLPAEGTIT